MTLGQPVWMGTFECVNSSVSVSGYLPTLLAVPPADQQKGNPCLSGSWLFYDDETSAENDLFVSTVTGSLPSATFGAGVRIPEPISTAGVQEIQPFYAGSRLYFTRSLSVVSSAHDGGDPTASASWAAVGVELGRDPVTRTGAIVAVGEPSVAHEGGRDWLYFVYAVARDQGVNMNVGRVPAR